MLDNDNYSLANVCVGPVPCVTLCHSGTCSQVSPPCSPSLPASCSAVQPLVSLTDKHLVFSKCPSSYTCTHACLVVCLKCPPSVKNHCVDYAVSEQLDYVVCFVGIEMSPSEGAAFEWDGLYMASIQTTNEKDQWNFRALCS